MLSKMRSRLLVALAVVTIAIGGVSAYLLNNHALVASPSPGYRYKAKFEYGWESVLVGTHFPSLMVPVETFITTHVNVFNPHDFPVNVTKYFVKIYPEPNEYYRVENCNYIVIPDDFDGRTCHMHIEVPERKGFEIDASDIKSWPPDPSNPIQWRLCECFWKGFVVIECPYDLEVVAVHDKVGVDVVNKITFHIDLDIPVVLPTGTYKLNEPYQLSFIIPWEPSNLTLKEVVLWELYAHNIPLPPETDDEIDSTSTYFDFKDCTSKMSITFILRATNKTWQSFLDEKWPPAQRPPDWVPPPWFRPCATLEKIVKIRSFPHIENSTQWETFWSMGDVNTDGYINRTDLNIIAANLGWIGPPGGNPADINNDGIVDIKDVYMCAGNLGINIWTYYLGITPEEQWGPIEKIRDVEKMVRDNINSTLIESGVPPSTATEILRHLSIRIIDVDVAEGVGTSMEVEYIKPEIIP